MSSSALVKGARGGGTVIAGRVARLAIQLTGTVLFARLLSPEDFGLVAMVGVFTALGSLLRDFGISLAGIQAKDLSKQQASNLFWLSSLLSLLVAVGLVILTPALSNLYSEPRLARIVPVLALSLFIDGLQAQIQVQIVRAMRFTLLTMSDLGAQISGLIAGLVLAVLGFGYWALVVQILTASTTMFLVRFLVVRWVPLWPRRGFDSRRLFRIGGEFGLAQLLAFVASNVDALIVGSQMGATKLGYYNRAFQLYQIPSSNIGDALTQVVIPTVRGATNEAKGGVSAVLLRIQFLLSLLMTWIYLVTAVTADRLIPMVMGDQWHEAILPFQILALGGVFGTFGVVSYWTFILTDQSRQLLRLHWITKPMIVVLLLVSVPYGISGVAFAYVLGQALAWPINLIWLARTVGQNSWAFFLLGLRVVLAAAFSFLGGYAALSLMPPVSSVLYIISGMAIASLVYVLGIVLIPGGKRHLADAVNIGVKVLGRR
ncbi:MAG: lipopolysaccharide biosynthesis protein [Ancrocorticia sp.]